MNKVLVAMALAIAVGSSAMAGETAEELVAVANTLAACLTPLAHEADKTAAKCESPSLTMSKGRLHKPNGNSWVASPMRFRRQL
jgi:hypothetical protein